MARDADAGESCARLASHVRKLIKELHQQSQYESVKEDLKVLNPDALLALGFEDAVIGYVANFHSPAVAVYDCRKCVDILVERDGMTPLEAEEFLSFNSLDAFVGENGPIFVETYR